MNRRDFLRTTGSTLGAWAAAAPLVAQQRPRRMGDVVVLLPGIMGSVLQKDGRDVWALSGSALFRALGTIGRSVESLRLSGDSDSDQNLGDGVTASRLIPDVHLLPGFWKIDGYSHVSHALRETFDLTEGQNYFEFPYDWRRDNRAAARRLARLSRDWLMAWKKRSGNRDARLVLVAHSMGGLVARYFIECLEGWRDTRRLVTFGTPYRGSLNALDTLVNGVKAGPVHSSLLTDLVRSFTSIYQLLPRYECFETMPGTLVRVGEATGIPNVDSRRAADALAFHREIDRCVEAHEREAAYRNGFWVHPIVGSYQRTLQLARRAGARIEFLTTYPKQGWDGDGTVPEPSAVPVELSDANREMYVAQLHGSLQNTPAVLTQLMKVLDRPDDGDWRVLRSNDVGGETRISLDVADLYAAAEPVTIRGTCSRADVPLTVSLAPTGNGAAENRRTVTVRGDGTYELSLSPLAEGTYRINVTGANAPVTVTDVFVVGS